MKKVILLLVILLFACTKEKPYTFTSTIESEFKYDVSLIEYSETNDIVNSVIINDVVVNKEYIFTATERTEKIKVRLTVYRPDEEVYCWIKQVYFLDDSPKIILTRDNILSYQEP